MLQTVDLSVDMTSMKDRGLPHLQTPTCSGVIITAHLWLHSLQIFWSANMPQNVFLNNCSCPVFCKEKQDTFVLDNLRRSLWNPLVIHFTYLKNFIKLICKVTEKFKSILKEKPNVTLYCYEKFIFFLERPPSTQQLIFRVNLKAQNYATLDAKYSKYLTNLLEQVIRKVGNIIQMGYRVARVDNE